MANDSKMGSGRTTPHFFFGLVNGAYFALYRVLLFGYKLILRTRKTEDTAKNTGILQSVNDFSPGTMPGES